MVLLLMMMGSDRRVDGHAAHSITRSEMTPRRESSVVRPHSVVGDKCFMPSGHAVRGRCSGS